MRVETCFNFYVNVHCTIEIVVPTEEALVGLSLTEICHIAQPDANLESTILELALIY